MGTVIGAEDIMVNKIQIVSALVVLISYHCTMFYKFLSFNHSLIYTFVHPPNIYCIFTLCQKLFSEFRDTKHCYENKIKIPVLLEHEF